MQSLTPEERKMATIVYTEISEHLTPDFSAEDWLNLHEKAIEGDLTLGKMWVSLWMRKVNPHLPPQLRMENNNYES